MTAKEMFKKEGYNLTINNNKELTYYRQRDRYNNYITFIKDIKHISIFGYNHYDKLELEIVEVNIKVFKAIQQQIKELGW